MNPMVRSIASPLAGPASGYSTAIGALANTRPGKRLAKLPSRIKSGIKKTKARIGFGPGKNESYTSRIAQKMYEEYPPGAEADMNRLYKHKTPSAKTMDAMYKDHMKSEKEKRNQAKIDKINNMGTRHGT